MAGVHVRGESPQDSDGRQHPAASDWRGYRRASWHDLESAGDNPHVLRRQALRRINADGGAAVELPNPDSHGEVDLHSPLLLPDGRNMVVAVHGPNNQFSIAVQPIDGDTRKTIVESGFAPTYLPSGHLVFGRGSTILAAPFDVTRLELTAPPVALVERVDSDPASGISQYHLSSSGALAYIPQRPRTGRTLTWMTSDGKATPIAVPAGALDAPRISPDGTTIAYVLEQEDGQRHIWINEFASGRRTQVTHDGDYWAPAWTRDGRGLAYAKANPSGSEVVYHHPISGEAVILARSTNRLFPAAFTPDSQTLLLVEAPPTDEYFISQLDMRRPGTISKFPTTGGYPRGASLSPDGRWIAFAATRQTSSRFLSRASRRPEHRARSASRAAAGRCGAGMVEHYSFDRPTACPPCRSTRHAGSPGARLARFLRGTSFRLCSIMMPRPMDGSR